MSNPEKRIKLDKFPCEISTNQTDLNDINDIILELSLRYHGSDKNTFKLSDTELLLCTRMHVQYEPEVMTLFEYIAQYEKRTADFTESINFLRSLQKCDTEKRETEKRGNIY